MKPFYRVDAEWIESLLKDADHFTEIPNSSGISYTCGIIKKKFPLTTPMSEEEMQDKADRDRGYTPAEYKAQYEGMQFMQERIFGKGEKSDV